MLPGFEGNMSIKWLRRLKIAAEPFMTREETSKYTDLMPDGRARQFHMDDAGEIGDQPAPAAGGKIKGGAGPFGDFGNRLVRRRAGKRGRRFGRRRRVLDTGDARRRPRCPKR